MKDGKAAGTDLIVLERAEIGYRGPLLPPIDLRVRAGERIAILGPNGSGKSTLLRTLCGVLPVLGGTLTYPRGARPSMGYVPQSHQPDSAFPLSMHEVVLMGCYRGLGVARRPRAVDHQETSRAIARVGLAGHETALFGKLSGGQRQRALLARALVGRPEILVLDEPTSELDPGAEHAFLHLVDAVSAELHTCVIFVTHQINAAAKIASEVVLINQTAGLVEQGAVQTMLTAEKLSQLYGLPIEVARATHGGMRVWTAASATLERP